MIEKLNSEAMLPPTDAILLAVIAYPVSSLLICQTEI